MIATDTITCPRCHYSAPHYCCGGPAERLSWEKAEAELAALRQRTEAAERRARTWKRAAKDWRAARNVARAGHQVTRESVLRVAAAYQAAEAQAAAMRSALSFYANTDHYTVTMRSIDGAAYRGSAIGENLGACARAALAPDAGSRVLARLAAAEALVAALPECECCERKATRSWVFAMGSAEFCDEHGPSDWCGEREQPRSGPWPVGYEDALRAWEAGR